MPKHTLLFVHSSLHHQLQFRVTHVQAITDVALHLPTITACAGCAELIREKAEKGLSAAFTNLLDAHFLQQCLESSDT